MEATHSLCIIYDCGACEHFSRGSEKEKSVFAGSAYRSINQLTYEGDNQLNNITPLRNSLFALCGGLFIYRDVKVALGFFYLRIKSLAGETIKPEEAHLSLKLWGDKI
jgi:hypothetical protein